MIDLMAMLTTPGAVPGTPTLPGLALGREEGFDAVLDAVVAQIASLLVPVAPPTATPVPTDALLTGGFAPPVPPTNPENVDSAVTLVAPNAESVVEVLATPPAMPGFVAAVAPVVRPQPSAKETPVASVSGKPVPKAKQDDVPLADAPPVADALIAAIRVGLGLPSTVPPVATPVVQGDKPSLPDQAVAVGRTGQMPTLPEHAQAVLPMPPGIARRFPAVPSTPAPGFAPPLPPTKPENVDSAPVLVAQNVDVESSATPVPVVMQTETPDAPVLADVARPHVPTIDTPKFEMPSMLDMPDLPELLGMPDLPDLIATPQPTVVAKTVAASVVAPSMPVVSEPVDAEPVVVDDSGPIVGVPVDESKPAMQAANADHTPVPVFDATAPTQEDRLSAIAPPLISSSDDPADNNDTIDTLAPHEDVAISSTDGQAAVSQTQTVRPERADRTERVHEANGIAAPLRAALRNTERSNKRDGFEITVRLDPPELGAVRVRVFTQGDNVKITLHAENPEARTVLQDRRDDVKTLLRNEGFNLDGFDVETNDNRRQTSEQPNRRQANTPAPLFEATPELADDGALRL